MKKIVIHAGLHKTGSTSLQQFVRNNSEALRTKDIYVPAPGKISWENREVFVGSNVGGLHAIPRGLRDGDVVPLDAVLFDFERSGCTTAFLSSEGFDALTDNEIAVLQSRLRGYDVEVVLVLRHPLALARSFYCSLGRVGDVAPGQFLEQLKGRRIFNFRGLMRDYEDLGAIRIVPFEEVEDSAVALLEAAFGSQVAGALLNEFGQVPRIRESLPPEAAIAFGTMVRAFGRNESVEKGLYPHWVEWVQTYSGNYLASLPKRRTPYGREHEDEFLKWWVNQEFAPRPDDDRGPSAELVEQYQVPLEAVEVEEENIRCLLDEFLGASFPQKQVAGLNAPVERGQTSKVTGGDCRGRRDERRIEDPATLNSTSTGAEVAPYEYHGIVQENRVLNGKVAALEEEVREYLRIQKGRGNQGGKGQNRAPAKAPNRQRVTGPTAEAVYQSVRYRVGDILASAVGSPGLNTVLAPIRLVRLFREGLRRQRARRQRQRAAASRS